jgi:hypothetical protein
MSDESTTPTADETNALEAPEAEDQNTVQNEPLNFHSYAITPSVLKHPPENLILLKKHTTQMQFVS